MNPPQNDFLELLLRHQTSIKAFIGSILRDRQMRDDVFQEVALVLWQRFDEFDRSRSFEGWARGIAANKVLQVIRQRRRVPVSLDSEAIDALLHAFERIASQGEDRQEALADCLGRLPDRSREMLAMKYEQQLGSEEIGLRFQQSSVAVWKALSRIRAVLAECIRVRLSVAGDAG